MTDSDHDTAPHKLGVLGVGSIATAVVTGLCRGVGDPPTIVLAPRSTATATRLTRQHRTASVAANLQEVLDRSRTVLVCVPRSQADPVLRGLRFRADHTVVSVVAGLRIDRLATLVAPATTVVRAMPLMTSATRECATPVYPPTRAALDLFERLGKAVGAETEQLFEAMVAQGATVAAHLEYLDAIAGWLTERGLPATQARTLVGHTYAGFSRRLRGKEPFSALIAEVATPGGLNEQFASDLRGIRHPDAVAAGLDRLLDAQAR